MYCEEYRKLEREAIENRRIAIARGEFFVEEEPKLLLVVRIKGINKIAPKPRKILQLLRLTQINAAVFVKLTKATKELIKLIEPYVAFGSASLASVRKLVYKRGYLKVNKQRIPLTDNQIVEQNLKQFGIVCVEDIIHEIFTVGPNFKQVNNSLWPFRLSNPNGGFRKRKFQHFIQGGDFGNREKYINHLVKRMI